MLAMIQMLLQKSQKGQTMVEYALLLALIAIVVALAIPGVSGAVTALFGRVVTAL